MGADLQISQVRAVIFDVDGTLYAQGKLRRKMAAALLAHYALRPWQLRDILILRRFRAERERKAGYAGPDLESAQYAWTAENSAFSVGQVRAVVGRWMFREPNQYLLSCTYPGTQTFFKQLRLQGIKIGVYSDYPAHDKLAAMGLQADVVVSSTDPEVNSLKPNPDGLLRTANLLGFRPAECLFIGDRPELDGECARRAGMPCLIVDQQPFEAFDFYHNLQTHFSQPAHSLAL